MKAGIVIMFMYLASTGWSQDSFRRVDSISYSLFLNKDWNGLAVYGKKAAENNFDYYYLNLRTGIAFFELKQFKEATFYFQRALNNNSSSDFAREYLFWSYYNDHDELSAFEYYEQLPDSIKSKMDYKSSKVIEYVYPEFGLKFADKSGNSQNLYYTGFAVSHKFSPRINLIQSYNFSKQKAIWGLMNQQQYSLLPQIKINRNLAFSSGLTYVNYNSMLNYYDTVNSKTHDEIQTQNGKIFIDTVRDQSYKYIGNYREDMLISQLNLTAQKGNWLFTPHLTLGIEWIKPDYFHTKNTITRVLSGTPMHPPDQITISSTYDSVPEYTYSIYSLWQSGFDITYTFGKKLSIGCDINYISGKGISKWNFYPYVSYRMNNKVAFSVSYVDKGNYMLMLNKGATILNSYDAIKKVSTSAQFRMTQKVSLYTTYQWENVLDNLSLREYTFNALFIGLKFKL